MLRFSQRRGAGRPRGLSNLSPKSSGACSSRNFGPCKSLYRDTDHRVCANMGYLWQCLLQLSSGSRILTLARVVAAANAQPALAAFSRFSDGWRLDEFSPVPRFVLLAVSGILIHAISREMLILIIVDHSHQHHQR